MWARESMCSPTAATDSKNNTPPRRQSWEGETRYCMEPQVGTILEGKVKSITKFGAFVTLEGGKSGLVHISEVASTFVNDVNDYLEIGQSVKVLVMTNENGKIGLSIRRAEPAPRSNSSNARRGGTSSPQPRQNNSRSHAPRQAAEPVSAESSFEDKLKRFLTSSEGKMADLNRNMDSKRGRRRK